MPDIVELILADHRRIRRLVRVVEDTGHRRGSGRPPSPLAPLWHRLTGLLDLHFAAEQAICYPALTSADPAQLAGALAEHAGIRAALAEASRHEVGSVGWFRAASPALRMTVAHLPGEEQGLLASFACRSAPRLRKDLGRRWVAFTAGATGPRPVTDADPAGLSLRADPAALTGYP